MQRTRLTSTDRDLLAAQDYMRKTWLHRRAVAPRLTADLNKQRLLQASNAPYTGSVRATNGRYDFLVSFRKAIKCGDAQVELFASLKIRNVPGKGKNLDIAIKDARDNARKFLADGIRGVKNPLRDAFMKKASVTVLDGTVSAAKQEELKNTFRMEAGNRLRAADHDARQQMLAQFSLI